MSGRVLDAGDRGRRSVAKLAIVLLVFGSPLLLGMPAARADCPILDPLCVVETVEDTVGGTVETVEDTVDGTVETVEESVEVVVETVEETATEVVGAVEETVDTVSGQGSLLDEVAETVVEGEVVPKPDPGGAGGGVIPGTGSGRDGSDEGRIGGTLVATTSIGSSAPAPATDPVGNIRTAPSDGPTGFGSLLDNVVAGLAFPVILTLIVAAFVAMQNRLDRRDPKLALAPVGPDVVNFA